MKAESNSNILFYGYTSIVSGLFINILILYNSIIIYNFLKAVLLILIYKYFILVVYYTIFIKMDLIKL